MPPKNLISTYIELLSRGEHISNATLRRKNSRSPLIPTSVLFEQYATWYRDVAGYFDALGEEASYLIHRFELTFIPADTTDRQFYHYTNKQLSNEVDKLRHDVSLLKKAIRDSRPFVEKQVSTSDTSISIKRGGYSLRFNTLTGEVVLNKLKTHMPVGQKKYTALKCIVTGPGHKATYSELYKELGLEKHLEKERRVHDIIREVKTHLKILPIKNALNPNIIKSIPGDGYALK
ncbi:hypothetical protein KC865_03900 [Candidatus Kaiserbacteria bacterium]|nr:hypothetical protein [Candidatus Kaiserbacteria bacterium]